MVGGVFDADQRQFGLILSGVEARRSSFNTMWQAEYVESFTSFAADPSTFTADLSGIRGQIE